MKSAGAIAEIRGEEGVGRAIRKVLVVDDSRLQRRILSASLQRWGYEVIEAGTGAEALEFCRRQQVDLVLSDWVMPGMDGLEFCRAFRALPHDLYGYFILLTSHNEKGAVARGLDVGADDFLPKPVDPEELRARINAGERLLHAERALQQNNRLLGDALDELRGLYDSLDRDLAQARSLQQSLLRQHHHRFGTARVSLLLRPSGHVGGDMVGVFPVNAARIGLFAFDVSGHGVTSALMTARLAGLFSGASAEQNIALQVGADGQVSGRPPAEVAAHVNRLIMEEMATEHYLTLVYGEADHASGRVTLVQAGHPHPAVQGVDGAVRFIGGGGLPVGLFDDACFEQFELVLAPGERLLLMSDGFTECAAPDGAELGEEGLARLMQAHRSLRGNAFLDALLAGLEQFAGTTEMRDDISAVLFEYAQPEG